MMGFVKHVLANDLSTLIMSCLKLVLKRVVMVMGGMFVKVVPVVETMLS